jgi:hypothetical protein
MGLFRFAAVAVGRSNAGVQPEADEPNDGERLWAFRRCGECRFADRRRPLADRQSGRSGAKT